MPRFSLCPAARPCCCHRSTLSPAHTLETCYGTRTACGTSGSGRGGGGGERPGPLVEKEVEEEKEVSPTDPFGVVCPALSIRTLNNIARRGPIQESG